MIDTNTTLGNRYLDEYGDRYPDAIAPEPIPDSQDIPNTTDAGETLFARDGDELLATAQRAREAYAANATELITRIQP
jgi:chromosome partitioning protein